MKINFSAITDIGAVRANNEDNFLVLGDVYREDTEDKHFSDASYSDEDNQIYAVCDGMGGLSKGEMASFITVSELAKYYPFEKFDSEFSSIVSDLNKKVFDYTVANELDECGTTLVLLHINEGKGKVYNVGDSEGFLFRNGKLKKLSRDDTVYQQYLDLGVEISFGKNALTQYIGVNPDEIFLSPHISDEVELSKGDIFLLNSDGVTNSLEIKEIEKILSSRRKVNTKAKKIIELCNKHKCHDNVTVVLVEVDDL